MDSSDVTSQPKGKKGQFMCPICDDAVGKEPSQDSVECSGVCSTWLHRQCAGFPKETFREVSKSDLSFFCPQCRIDKQSNESTALKVEVLKLSS